jgi:hypothetical protein
MRRMLALVVEGCVVVEGRVATLAVVEDLDEVEYGGPGRAVVASKLATDDHRMRSAVAGFESPRGGGDHFPTLRRLATDPSQSR